MNDNLCDLLINKKKNKEKILIFSFTDILNLQIIVENADILRFDLKEFAFLYGYKDVKRIKQYDFLPLLKNIHFFLKEKSKFLAVDVPFYILGEEYGNSFKKITEFYIESLADFFIIDYNYINKDFIKKITQIKIPMFINSVNKLNINERKLFYNEMLELESFGIAGIILEDFDDDFIIELKKSLSIPVICDNIENRCDGFYGKFTKLFGLELCSSNKRYLNYIELLKESFNDCIKEIKSEKI